MQFALHILIISRFCSTNLLTNAGLGFGGVNRNNATKYNTSPSGNTTDVRESHLQKNIIKFDYLLDIPPILKPKITKLFYKYIGGMKMEQVGRGVYMTFWCKIQVGE